MGKEKNLAKKAQAQQEKDNAATAAAEAAEAASWDVGAKKDKKGAAEKEAEKLKKAADKAAALAEEDAVLASVVVKKGSTKKAKKGKDDFAELQAALASAPKTAAQKAAERKAAEQAKKKEERMKAEQDAKAAKEARDANEMEQAKLYASKGMVSNHMDDLLSHKKANNKLDDEDTLDLTGLESVFDALAGGMPDKHPRMKAIYTAYYQEQLPIFKEEHPGLKLSQYKERIYEAFQKAPENPNNQTKGKT